MIETVFGKTTKPAAVASLQRTLANVNYSGSLYLGYPLLRTPEIGAPPDTAMVDAMLVSQELGVVIFDLVDDAAAATTPGFWETRSDAQDALYGALHSRLFRHKMLRRGRELGFVISVITYGRDLEEPPSGFLPAIATNQTSLLQVLAGLAPISRDLLDQINSVIQSVTTLRPAKRRADVKLSDSRGAVLKKIEASISYLDRRQKQAAIETGADPLSTRSISGSWIGFPTVSSIHAARSMMGAGEVRSRRGAMGDEVARSWVWVQRMKSSQWPLISMQRSWRTA